MFCCQPDAMLTRDELVQQMRNASQQRTVNMAMVDDQLSNDRDMQMAHKRKWRRRWSLCCCCWWILLLVGSTLGTVYFAIGSWSLLCSGEDCGFSARMHLGSTFTPSKKIIIAAGTNTLVNFADVWEGSKDGKTWNVLTTAAPFGPRHGHALLCDSRNGALFALGGDVGGVGAQASRPVNDVWRSADGKAWSVVTSRAAWSQRKFFGSVIDENGHIFVSGGLTGYGTGGLNDVWKSEDGGKSWSALTLAAPWTARFSFAFTRLPGGTRPGRLYVLGGDDGRKLHDVWMSDDGGRMWELMSFTHTREKRYNVVEERASWIPRTTLAAIADKDGLLTLTGGLTDMPGIYSLSSEVWQLAAPPSTDLAWYDRKSQDDRLNTAVTPLQWELATAPPWTGREGHSMFSDDESTPHIVGGQDATGMKNDVWKMAMSVDVNNLKGLYTRGTALLNPPKDAG